ncbi:MAG: hypothetical protein GY780_01065 [bacterium]|nr:hypothetical protein [bacterium]
MRFKFRTLSIFFLIFFSACGTQDRYEPTSPSPYLSITEASLADIEAIPLVVNSTSDSRCVIVDDLTYIKSNNSQVYALTPDGYKALPPLMDYFQQIAVGPDYRLFVMSYNEGMFSLQDDQWVLEDRAPVYSSLDKLLTDNENRLLMYGPGAMALKRQETDGQWVEQVLPDNIELRSGWCDFGLPPVFVSYRAEVVTESEEGWQVSEPLAESLLNNLSKISGNASGDLAVMFAWEDTFALHLDNEWELHFLNSDLRTLFWQGEELYGVDYNLHELHHWSGSEFQFLLSLEDFDVEGVPTALNRGTETELVFGKGQSLLFDGAMVTRKSPALGIVEGMTSYLGQNHVVLSSGSHLIGDPETNIWHHAGQPFLDSDDFPDGPAVLVDEQDNLVFFSKTEAIRWEGPDNYSSTELPDRVFRVFPQQDGRVLLVCSEGIGLWAQGTYQFISEKDDPNSDIKSCQLTDDGEIWISTREHLSLLDQGESNIMLTFQGWFCEGGAWDSELEQIIFGDGRFVSIRSESVQYHTPAWQAGGSWHPAEITGALADGLGHWLALDTDKYSLLRFDGQSWQYQESRWLQEIGSNNDILDLRDGTFLIQSGSFNILVDLQGGSL